ncbi:7026_t:CDS:2, partial [Acaulospora colombiana]
VLIQDTLSLSYIKKSDGCVSKVSSNGTKHKISQYVNGSIGARKNGVNGNSNGITTNGVTNGEIKNSIDKDRIYKEINGGTSMCDNDDLNMGRADYDLSAIVIHSGSSAETTRGGNLMTTSSIPLR